MAIIKTQMVDNQIEKISIRLKEARKHLNKKQDEFANGANIPQSQVSEIENGKKNITPTILMKLEDAYGINRKWLLSGQGDMIVSKKTDTPQEFKGSKKESLSYQPNKHHHYMDQIRAIIKNDGSEPIEMTPVHNVHVTTGRISELLSSDKIPDVILLNGAFRGCDGVIRHTDPAMNGFFEVESYIGVKRISEASYTKRIIPGKCYVVVMGEYLLERFLYPGKDGSIILRSVNPEKDHDIEIDLDEIVELYLIKGWIQIPKLHST